MVSWKLQKIISKSKVLDSPTPRFIRTIFSKFSEEPILIELNAVYYASDSSSKQMFEKYQTSAATLTISLFPQCDSELISNGSALGDRGFPVHLCTIVKHASLVEDQYVLYQSIHVFRYFILDTSKKGEGCD